MTTEQSVQEQETSERAAMEWQAQAYAQEKEAHGKQGKTLDAARDKLKRFMELEDIDELVDGETGYGVELAPPRRTTTWDVQHMLEQTILALARQGLLTVNTTAFDALRKAAGSPVLDEAEQYRMTGEGAAPLIVRKPS